MTTVTGDLLLGLITLVVVVLKVRSVANLVMDVTSMTSLGPFIVVGPHAQVPINDSGNAAKRAAAAGTTHASSTAKTDSCESTNFPYRG